jgi:ribonuclease HI
MGARLLLWNHSNLVFTNTLTAACREDTAINVFCDGVISNKGRADGKQVGATSAALYQGGKERNHTERSLGQTLTETDAALRSLHSGLDALTTFLDSDATQQQKLITITIESGVAINRALDASPHEDQGESLKILRRLSDFLERFPNANITLLWLPRKVPFVGFKRAKQLALEAARTANLNDVAEPQTINSQKKASRDAVVTTLIERWHQSPQTSMAYRTALNAPPDGKTHHSFQPNHQTAPTEMGNTTTAKFSRLTHSTLYRIITGHAFVGEYTQRFFPQHTPDQIDCQCGEPLQTIENPKRIQELLRFLEETGACKRPRATWEPG